MAKAAKMSESPNLTADQLKELPERIEKYRQGVEQKHADYWKEGNYTHNPGSVAVIEEGGRYTRVWLREMIWVDERDHSKGVLKGSDDKPILKGGHGHGRGSIHTFIDTLTGDILKPASWKAPAKHARGNLFDESNGLARVNHFGPAYLR